LLHHFTAKHFKQINIINIYSKTARYPYPRPHNRTRTTTIPNPRLQTSAHKLRLAGNTVIKVIVKYSARYKFPYRYHKNSSVYFPS